MDFLKAALSTPRKLGPKGIRTVEAAARQQFISELVELHERANRIGLYKTGHALHEAVKVVGYEVAELMDKRRVFRRAKQQPGDAT